MKTDSEVSATESTARPAAALSLPPELIERAARRIRVLCVVLGGVALIYSLVTLLMQLGVIHTQRDLAVWAPGFYSVAACAVLLATGVYVAAGSRRLRGQRRIDLGLALQVLGALCITVTEHLIPVPDTLHGVSWVCVWILSFNVIPATPRRTAFAAFAAATMGPIGLILNAVFNHHVWPTLDHAILTFLPNYIAATIGEVTARLVHRLHTDVAQAKRMGSYKLVEKLGQGGMGEVWRAEHRTLIRPAAIKLIRRDIAGGKDGPDTDSVLRRFRREVQATALLQSPHTVAIYDFGRSDEGLLYYVMELLHGIDLQQLVKRSGPQPAERVIKILRQVCHSLADAHRAGLVHRDVKPANLQLCVLGLELDFVKVLDFGLVKSRRGKLDVSMTIAGTVQGTPAYLAPEAASGSEVDARADLYSLGCVAYWLLTGTTVFPGENALAMMAAHLRKPVDPPSRRSELPIPRALEELVLALLAKSPADRPQTALEVIRRLDAISVPTPWTQERAERWWRVYLPHILDHGGWQNPTAPFLEAVA